MKSSRRPFYNLKNFLIIVLLCLLGCINKKSDTEICFENLKNRIGSEPVLKRMMYCPLDSFFVNYGLIMNNLVNAEAKSDTICTSCLAKFARENNENSITVNNLIMFQYFQAYLRHEEFDHSKAKEKALEFERKWK